MGAAEMILALVISVGTKEGERKTAPERTFLSVVRCDTPAGIHTARWGGRGKGGLRCPVASVFEKA